MRRIRQEVEQQTGVTFSVTFAQRPHAAEEAQIAAELVALGLQHQPLWSVADFSRPNGARIVARRTENPHWCVVSDSAGWVDRQGHIQLQHCVAEKSPRSKIYGGPGVSDLRLLVVADAMLNSGKVAADPNVCIDLMGFTRVYLAAYPKDVVAFSPHQPSASI
jgi:hypothetical protein